MLVSGSTHACGISKVHLFYPDLSSDERPEHPMAATRSPAICIMSKASCKRINCKGQWSTMWWQGWGCWVMSNEWWWWVMNDWWWWWWWYDDDDDDDDDGDDDDDDDDAAAAGDAGNVWRTPRFMRYSQQGEGVPTKIHQTNSPGTLGFHDLKTALKAIGTNHSLLQPLVCQNPQPTRKNKHQTGSRFAIITWNNSKQL